MENLIDALTGFLIVSSALLLALGVLSCLVLNAFNIRGKARLLICSMLMIMPVAYLVGTLIPDHRKVPLPSEKLQAIFPAGLESVSNTIRYDKVRPAGTDVSPATEETPAAIEPLSTQTASPVLYGSTSKTFNWKQAISAAWIFLFVSMLIRSYLLFGKMKRLVKFADCVTDPSILKVFQQCRNETGLRRSPRLLAVNHTLTPMVAGFFQPAVILPARLLTPAFREGLRFTLLHELKHIQRRDNWWLLLESLVGAIYFFHPVIYWAKQKIHEEWEHICDRHVVQVTKKPASYADFLLHEIWNRGRQMNSSLATPLIFKPRRTAKRVHAILAKMTPTLFSKIRDRIAISTVFVCLISVFLFTVTPSANVNKNKIKIIQPEWDQLMVNGNAPPIKKDTETREPVSVNNEPIAENKAAQKSEHETASAASVAAFTPASLEPAPSSEEKKSIPKNKVRDEKLPTSKNFEKENSPAVLTAKKESPVIDAETLSAALTEKAGVPEKEVHPSGNAALFETSDLLASIGPDSLLTPPQMPQEVSVSSDEKNAEPYRSTGKEADNGQQDRSAISMKNELSSENVSIPIGARIFDWKMVDRRNIIIETYFYGSFKATLTEDRPKISSKDIAGVETPWPYAVTETSVILLSDGDECRIQKLVPYAEKRGNVYDVF